MNILLLCNRVPFPLKDGGAIAVYNMITGLKNAGNTVDVFALNTKKDFLNPSELPQELITKGSFYTADIDTTVRAIPALLNLFSKNSYNISRFYNTSVDQKLINHLKNKQFDIIQIEGLFMLPYVPSIRKYSDAKIMFRAHNVEAQIWSRLANAAIGIKKWYLSLLSERIKTFESIIPGTVDYIIPITAEDASYFKNNFPSAKIFVSPAGVNLENFKLSNTIPEAKSLFHLGALNWIPNQEAVQWLLTDIFQKLISIRSDFTIHIAGKHTPEHFYQYSNANIVVLGEIDNAVDFINSKSIMLVPLLSGSGMRLKIVEGMSLGKAIISTSVGAEGIRYTNQENIIIANTTDEFVTAIQDLLDHPEKIKHIGLAAKKLIEEEYDNKHIVGKLNDFYKEVLK